MQSLLSLIKSTIFLKRECIERWNTTNVEIDRIAIAGNLFVLMITSLKIYLECFKSYF